MYHKRYGDIDTATTISEALNRGAGAIAPFRQKSSIIHVGYSVERAPAPAWYELNTADVFIDLSQIAPRLKSWKDRDSRFGTDIKTFSALEGVVVHELAHSAYTDWLTFEMPNDIRSTLMIFEEGRIERRAIASAGAAAAERLRSMFSTVLLPEFSKTEDLTSPFQAAGLYGLTLGRVLASYIDDEETLPIEMALRTVLTDGVVNQLEDILAQAVGTVSTGTRVSFKNYYDLAAEWNEVLRDEFGEDIPAMKTFIMVGEIGDAPPETGDAGDGDAEGTGADSDEDETAGTGKSGPTSEADEDQDDSDDSAGGADDGDGEHDEADNDDGEEAGTYGDGSIGTVDSVKGAADATGEDHTKWLHEQSMEEVLKQAMQQVAARTAKKRGRGPDVRSKASQFASVFRGVKPNAKSHWLERKPNAEEREAATLLTRLLEEMSTPAIVKTRASSELPPGRLRSREAVRMSADKASGRMSKARPWRMEKRAHDTAPPIIVGIATDTSGSMKWAEEMVASTAWIFATAGHRIGAQVAAVTFGEVAEAVVMPRELPSNVRIRKANGSLEAFDDAMAALDSVLHYTDHRPGRKVLIVVSDAQFVRSGEDPKRASWLRALADASVEVVWMNNTEIEYIRDLFEGADDHKTKVLGVRPGDYNGMVRAVINAINKK